MYLSIFVFFTVVSFFYDIATLRCYTSVFDGFIGSLIQVELWWLCTDPLGYAKQILYLVPSKNL